MRNLNKNNCLTQCYSAAAVCVLVLKTSTRTSENRPEPNLEGKKKYQPFSFSHSHYSNSKWKRLDLIRPWIDRWIKRKKKQVVDFTILLFLFFVLFLDLELDSIWTRICHLQRLARHSPWQKKARATGTTTATWLFYCNSSSSSRWHHEDTTKKITILALKKSGPHEIEPNHTLWYTF